MAFFSDLFHSSSLGYGTTSLMAVSSTQERLKLLNTAFDAGISHFDTAPYYGYGEAERLLGDFAVGKRDRMTITTKFGIQPPTIVKSRWVNLLARRVLKCLPLLRKSLSQKASAMTQKGNFNPEVARKSLDQSLKSLKTDYVDLFLLHEPELLDAGSDQIIQFLEAEVKKGRICAYGCGGEFDKIQAIAQANLSTSRWLQFEDNLLQRNLDIIRPYGAKCITFRTFHAGLTNLSAWLEADSARVLDWQKQIQLNLKEKGVLSSLMLAASLARNQEGIVLFSSSQVHRITDAAAVARGRFSLDQLVEFEQLTRTIDLKS